MVRPLIFDATAVAQAAVPQALVIPAPLSQTLTLIKLSLTTLAIVTLHFSGKSLWFSILGPMFSNSKISKLSVKKITCGFPTFIAMPPMCSLLFLSKIFNLRFLVFKFSLKGISSQLVFGIPILVSTKLLFKIFDFIMPEEVDNVISFLLFCFESRSATHLDPFPHAPDKLPSELKILNLHLQFYYY